MAFGGSVNATTWRDIDASRLATYSNLVQHLRAISASDHSMIKTTYSQARENLASLLNQVTRDREIAIIQRRGNEDVALVSADELSGLLETAHLLRSPANAKRLLTALRRSQTKKLPATTLDALRAELGINGKK